MVKHFQLPALLRAVNNKDRQCAYARLPACTLRAWLRAGAPPVSTAAAREVGVVPRQRFDPVCFTHRPRGQATAVTTRRRCTVMEPLRELLRKNFSRRPEDVLSRVDLDRLRAVRDASSPEEWAAHEARGRAAERARRKAERAAVAGRDPTTAAAAVAVAAAPEPAPAPLSLLALAEEEGVPSAADDAGIDAATASMAADLLARAHSRGPWATDDGARGGGGGGARAGGAPAVVVVVGADDARPPSVTASRGGALPRPATAPAALPPASAARSRLAANFLQRSTTGAGARVRSRSPAGSLSSGTHASTAPGAVATPMGLPPARGMRGMAAAVARVVTVSSAAPHELERGAASFGVRAAAPAGGGAAAPPSFSAAWSAGPAQRKPSEGVWAGAVTTTKPQPRFGTPGAAAQTAAPRRTVSVPASAHAAGALASGGGAAPRPAVETALSPRLRSRSTRLALSFSPPTPPRPASREGGMGGDSGRSADEGGFGGGRRGSTPAVEGAVHRGRDRISYRRLSASTAGSGVGVVVGALHLSAGGEDVAAPARAAPVPKQQRPADTSSTGGSVAGGHAQVGQAAPAWLRADGGDTPSFSSHDMSLSFGSAGGGHPPLLPARPPRGARTDDGIVAAVLASPAAVTQGLSSVSAVARLIAGGAAPAPPAGPAAPAGRDVARPGSADSSFSAGSGTSVPVRTGSHGAARRRATRGGAGQAVVQDAPLSPPPYAPSQPASAASDGGAAVAALHARVKELSRALGMAHEALLQVEAERQAQAHAADALRAGAAEQAARAWAVHARAAELAATAAGLRASFTELRGHVRAAVDDMSAWCVQAANALLLRRSDVRRTAVPSVDEVAYAQADAEALALAASALALAGFADGTAPARPGNGSRDATGNRWGDGNRDVSPASGDDGLSDADYGTDGTADDADVEYYGRYWSVAVTHAGDSPAPAGARPTTDGIHLLLPDATESRTSLAAALAVSHRPADGGSAGYAAGGDGGSVLRFSAVQGGGDGRGSGATVCSGPGMQRRMAALARAAACGGSGLLVCVAPCLADACTLVLGEPGTDDTGARGHSSGLLARLLTELDHRVVPLLLPHDDYTDVPLPVALSSLVVGVEGRGRVWDLIGCTGVLRSNEWREADGGAAPTLAAALGPTFSRAAIVADADTGRIRVLGSTVVGVPVASRGADGCRENVASVLSVLRSYCATVVGAQSWYAGGGAAIMLRLDVASVADPTPPGEPADGVLLDRGVVTVVLAGADPLAAQPPAALALLARAARRAGRGEPQEDSGGAMEEHALLALAADVLCAPGALVGTVVAVDS